MSKVTFQKHQIHQAFIHATQKEINKYIDSLKGIEIIERKPSELTYKYVDPYEYIAARQRIRNKRKK
jgi:hypothetical protein